MIWAVLMLLLGLVVGAWAQREVTKDASAETGLLTRMDRLQVDIRCLRLQTQTWAHDVVIARMQQGKLSRVIHGQRVKIKKLKDSLNEALAKLDEQWGD